MYEQKNTVFLSKKKEMFLYLFILSSIICIYFQVVNNSFIELDSYRYINFNQHTVTGISFENLNWAITSVHVGNWHPLTWVSHMIDCELFGINPAGHNIMNVFFHSLNSLLLFYLLKKITSLIWPAFITTFLFAIHPTHVESVAWIAERKDVLSTFFFLLSILAYCSYISEKKTVKYLASLLFHLLGLLSKPMVITLPCVLILLDMWPLERIKTGNSYKNTYRLFMEFMTEKIPFFLLSLFSGIITIIAQNKDGALQYLEKLSIGERTANALVSYIAYIGKIIWPFNLSIYYPYRYNIPVTYVFLCFLSLAAISVISFKTSKTMPWIKTGWLWFLGTLLPVIGIIQVGSQSMADRYLYIPSIGVFIIISWTMYNWLYYDKKKSWGISAVLVLVALGLIFLSYRQVGLWKNSEALYEASLNNDIDNTMIHKRLGYIKLKQGRFAESIYHYTTLMRFSNIDAEICNNLGVGLYNIGKKKEAIKLYKKALTYNPYYDDAVKNLKNAEAAEINESK